MKGKQIFVSCGEERMIYTLCVPKWCEILKYQIVLNFVFKKSDGILLKNEAVYFSSKIGGV